jgi:anti-anti-sigma factor
MDAQGQPGLPTEGPATGLTLTVRDEGRTRIVALRGAVELEEADQFRAHLPALIEPPFVHMILDLAELRFINSTGLSALLKVYQRVKHESGSLAIVNPSPSIANLLRLTRLSELVPVYPSLEAAQAALPAATR